MPKGCVLFALLIFFFLPLLIVLYVRGVGDGNTRAEAFLEQYCRDFPFVTDADQPALKSALARIRQGELDSLSGVRLTSGSNTPGSTIYRVAKRQPDADAEPKIYINDFLVVVSGGKNFWLHVPVYKRRNAIGLMAPAFQYIECKSPELQKLLLAL